MKNTETTSDAKELRRALIKLTASLFTMEGQLVREHRNRVLDAIKNAETVLQTTKTLRQ